MVNRQTRMTTIPSSHNLSIRAQNKTDIDSSTVKTGKFHFNTLMDSKLKFQMLSILNSFFDTSQFGANGSQVGHQAKLLKRTLVSFL